MIWLIGAGSMAMDYAKVLNALETPTIVIGRGKESAKKFSESHDFEIETGGLDNWLKSKPTLPDAVIVAVNVEYLAPVTSELINYGIKKILLEKPGGINSNEVENLNIKANQANADIYIAYNRRFYASTIHAQKMIEDDGGVNSFNFEFTEWAHVIEKTNHPQKVLNNWFLANSTHVVDLAFYLGGKPKEISTFTSGSLKWHPNASVFAGAGVTLNGAIFSYQANWSAPGRWGIEILTKKHRYYFRPMEKLQVQKIGSIILEDATIDYSLDYQFKPGIWHQVNSFLLNNETAFCTLSEQLVSLKNTYKKICQY